MTLYLKNTASGEAVEIEIAQGQAAFTAELPPGEYVAYAHTVGTELAGGYTGGELWELLPFAVRPDQPTTGIDLCNWYDPPGLVTAETTGEATVTVTTLQNMNVFPQPSLAEFPLATVPPRLTAPAVARNGDGAWLQVKEPAGGNLAWIYAPLTQVSGRPEALPILPSDPTKPVPIGDQAQFAPATWTTEFNESIVQFKGYIRDEAGNPVNGYSVLLDNGTWSVLSHPTGASRHYPDTEDGAWDLVITNAADAAGWWALTVVSYDCPDFETGFNAQCKQFTPLSATQIVKVVYPDGNIINADWLCRRNCDQGLYAEAYRP